MHGICWVFPVTEQQMVGKLILQGLIAGICAGLLAFGFARALGEPSVETAVQFESAQDEAKADVDRAAGKEVEPEEPEVFSRAVQSGIGLLTGVVVIGAGLGALFGVLFAIANGRVGNWGPGATSALLAFLGWMTVYMVPALKYPANPPSVGEPDTIRIRTALYFLVMAISVASTIGAWALGRRLTRRYGLWNGCIAAVIAYLLVLTIVFQLLPPVNEVPGNFPAVTLWDFRVASAGLQTVLWGAVGMIFGTLVERTHGAHR
jgi:Probable cobalt transporter subunit (CbtA)